MLAGDLSTCDCPHRQTVSAGADDDNQGAAIDLRQAGG